MIDFLAWSGSGAVVGSFATILFNYVRNRKVDKQKEKSLADSKLEKKRIRQMEAVRSVYFPSVRLCAGGSALRTPKTIPPYSAPATGAKNRTNPLSSRHGS